MIQSDGTLASALASLGATDRARTALVEACLAAERELGHVGAGRDQLTGPIVDALHAQAGTLRKTLSTGEVFEFSYRSKIAREFVMAGPKAPDHVWEPQTTKLLCRLAERSKQALVGGAYFGDHAVLIASRQRANGGTCHAFEPNEEQAATLARNAELNDLGNLVVKQLGLWSADGTLGSLVGEDAYAHTAVAEREHGSYGTFETVTVDSYLREKGIEALDLMMIDVEGGELEVLNGAAGQLLRQPGEAPAVVFEVHRTYVDWSEGLDRTEIVRLLASSGYTVYALRDINANQPMRDKPIELVPLDDIYLEGPPHGFNMFAFKGDAVLEAIAPYSICPAVSPKLLRHGDPKLHHPLDGFD